MRIGVFRQGRAKSGTSPAVFRRSGKGRIELNRQEVLIGFWPVDSAENRSNHFGVLGNLGAVMGGGNVSADRDEARKKARQPDLLVDDPARWRPPRRSALPVRR